MIQNFVKRLNNMTSKNRFFKGFEKFSKYSKYRQIFFSESMSTIVKTFSKKKYCLINSELSDLLKYQILQNQLFVSFLDFENFIYEIPWT